MSRTNVCSSGCESSTRTTSTRKAASGPTCRRSPVLRGPHYLTHPLRKDYKTQGECACSSPQLAALVGEAGGPVPATARKSDTSSLMLAPGTDLPGWYGRDMGMVPLGAWRSLRTSLGEISW